MLPSTSKAPSISAAEQKTLPHDSLHSALAACDLQLETMGLHMLADDFMEVADATRASLQKMLQVDRSPHQALAIMKHYAFADCKQVCYFSVVAHHFIYIQICGQCTSNQLLARNPTVYNPPGAHPMHSHSWSTLFYSYKPTIIDAIFNLPLPAVMTTSSPECCCSCSS